MNCLSVSRWMVQRALRTPTGWLWILCAGAVLPTCRVLTPVGVLGHPASEEALTSQAAFLAGLVGSMLAVTSLGDNSWVLSRTSSARAMVYRLAGIATCAALGAAIVMAVLCVTRSEWAPSGLYLASILTTAHIAVLATALLSLPLAPSQAVAALPILTWVLPAAVRHDTGSWSGLITFLQVHRDPGQFEHASFTTLATTSAPILALGALLLAGSLRKS